MPEKMAFLARPSEKIVCFLVKKIDKKKLPVPASPEAVGHCVHLLLPPSDGVPPVQRVQTVDLPPVDEVLFLLQVAVEHHGVLQY